MNTLKERFEPQNQCEIYKALLKQRIRKRDEGFPELAQDIKGLTKMAYPSAFIDLKDTLSKDSFIEALNDAEMELFICQKEPATTDDAVRLALKYEAFTQGRRKQLSSNKAGIRMQYEEDTHSTISRNDIEEIKNDIRKLRTGSNGQHNRGKPNPNNNRSCYACGQTDHMVRSCPLMDSPDTHDVTAIIITTRIVIVYVTVFITNVRADARTIKAPKVIHFNRLCPIEET